MKVVATQVCCTTLFGNENRRNANVLRAILPQKCMIRRSWLPTPSSSLSSSNNLLASPLLLQGVFLGCSPDGQAEPDLVDEVGKVVDQVQRAVRDGTEQVAEEVAKRVDGPANRDDEAHGAERAGHSRGHLGARALACLALEDLEEDEEPAGHAHCETNPWVDDQGLSHVAEQQHDHSADEESEEHAGTEIGLDRLQNEEKLDHLQRDGQAPVNVTVHNGAHVDGHPELAHVEVV